MIYGTNQAGVAVFVALVWNCVCVGEVSVFWFCLVECVAVVCTWLSV